MSPGQILKDDINRASKAQQEQHKSENQIVAKEFEEQMKANNKPSSSVAYEIKLKVDIYLPPNLILMIQIL